MKATLIRPIGRRNQVTIPNQLLKRLGLHPGDFVNFVQEGKVILLRPMEVVEKEEWTKEDLDAMQRLFKEQKRKKQYIGFGDTQSALNYLRKIMKQK